MIITHVNPFLGPSCIRMNQSLTRSKKQQEAEIVNLHATILQSIRHHLLHKQRIPLTASIYKRYSDALLHCLKRCYSTPVSYREHMQAEKQAAIAASIRKKIRRHNLILRVTDKGNNFYLGSAKDFETKVQHFFAETKAFTELDKNPFHTIHTKITQLLNRLSRENAIERKQLEKLTPNLSTAELAHLYFNPKTHKVSR